MVVYKTLGFDKYINIPNNTLTYRIQVKCTNQSSKPFINICGGFHHQKTGEFVPRGGFGVKSEVLAELIKVLKEAQVHIKELEDNTEKE